MSKYLSENLKLHVISFIQSFISNFATVFGTLIITIPTDTLLNPETYTRSFIAGIILSAVRSAVKLSWEKSPLPETLGGSK